MTDVRAGSAMHESSERAPRHFMGRVFLAVFRTGLDLGQWVPRQLVADDPHVGLLKVYQMKTRFEGEPPLPLALSQYTEACMGVMARPEAVELSQDLRGYNLINWHSRPWALGRGNPFGHRIRLGNVETTWTFPSGSDYDRDTGSHSFAVDVDRLGHPFVTVRAQLGEPAPRIHEPSFNGFFTLTPGAPRVDGTAGDPTVVTEGLEALVEGTPTYGTGSLQFRSLPDDQASERDLLDGLGLVEVLGCSLRDISWIRQFPRVFNATSDWSR